MDVVGGIILNFTQKNCVQVCDCEKRKKNCKERELRKMIGSGVELKSNEKRLLDLLSL